jgi:hypothetical protein
MNQHKITMNLWQWANFIDLLMKIELTFSLIPLPEDYKSIPEYIKQIIFNYHTEHSLGISFQEINPITKGPVILLDKTRFEKEFSKELSIGIALGDPALLNLKIYLQRVSDAMNKPPKDADQAHYEIACKQAIASFLSQLNAQQ